MFALLAIVTLHIIPWPSAVSPGGCGGVPVPHSVPRSIDAAALDELNERWIPMGIGAARRSASSAVRFTHDPSIIAQGYRLRVDSAGVTIASSDSDGAFYGAMTLAQLPVRTNEGWRLPCVQIADAPKLRWRVLSDDVSRGPLPTMQYFRERIRTIAAFKMNGYSPYMEHVFLSPTDPLPAPLDGITPAQLGELKAYAARYHVTFIPEQQTFAHMHNTLRVEQYASMAEFPHGFLLSPGPQANAYLARIIGQEREAVGDVPFFHIGSDETATLGEGQTTSYVAANGGRSAVYAAHVNSMAKLVAPARVMLWDDGIENDPSIMQHIPKNAVIVNWHYGAEKSFAPFISTIAKGGLDQMVAPGANNWNEIFPDLSAALPNEERFIAEGIDAHVFGLFQTVWHDDGETLFESTWYPVLYSGALAWGGDAAGGPAFARDFPSAFFGVDDPRYARDIQLLGGMDARMPGPSNKRFWADPFDQWNASQMEKVDLASLRLAAEEVETHLYSAAPPLHRNAAGVMLLAARRYDALGRRYQIAQEVRFYYDHAKHNPKDAERDLYWCKYWFWEQRDTDEMLEPLYARAWRYEDRESHLASNLERYHLDAQLAIRRADAIDRVTYQFYETQKTLPDLQSVIQ